MRFAMPGMFEWDDLEDYETQLYKVKQCRGGNMAGHMEAHALTWNIGS
jgi:hypothetical protein